LKEKICKFALLQNLKLPWMQKTKIIFSSSLKEGINNIEDDQIFLFIFSYAVIEANILILNFYNNY